MRWLVVRMIPFCPGLSPYLEDILVCNLRTSCLYLLCFLVLFGYSVAEKNCFVVLFGDSVVEKKNAFNPEIS